MGIREAAAAAAVMVVVELVALVTVAVEMKIVMVGMEKFRREECPPVPRQF